MEFNRQTFIFICLVLSGSVNWDYGDVAGWSSLGYPACTHSKQSPVDIETNSVQTDTLLRAFKLTNYEGISAENCWAIENSGRSVGVGPCKDNPWSASVSEGGLPGSYKPSQFHFHWGSSDGRGSEHTIDGKTYPLELHIVHYSTKYQALGDAVDKDKGLAVLGAFIEVTENEENKNYTSLIEGLRKIKSIGSKTETAAVPLRYLLPEDLSRFYRYQGSLTTPPCHQSVVWTVFKEPVRISKQQMSAFRKLLDENNNHINDNYRPVQHLNGRTVYQSLPAGLHDEF